MQFWGGERGTEKHTQSALSTMCVHFILYQGKSKGLTHTHTRGGAGTVCSQLHKNTQKTTDFLLANVSWLKGYTQDPTQFSTYFVALLFTHERSLQRKNKAVKYLISVFFTISMFVLPVIHLNWVLYTRNIYMQHIYMCAEFGVFKPTSSHTYTHNYR